MIIINLLNEELIKYIFEYLLKSFYSNGSNLS